MGNKKLIQTTAIIICHGKSEKIFAEYLKSNLKIPIVILSESNGKNSIQIGRSLDVYISNRLKDKNSLKKMAENIKITKKYPENLKIFPIMDLDDTLDSSIITGFRSGEVFKNHWLSDLFVPIYNDKNFEEALKSMGREPAKHKNTKVKDYIRVFPVQRGESDINAIFSFWEDCKKCSKTNMEELLEYLINYSLEVGQIKKSD